MAPLFEQDARYPYLGAYRVLREVVELQEGQRKHLESFDPAVHTPPADRFFQIMAMFWVHADEAKTLREPATVLLNTAQENGYGWFAAELTEL